MENTSRWNLYTRVEVEDLQHGDHIFILTNEVKETGVHAIFHNATGDMVRYGHYFDTDTGGGCGGSTTIFRFRPAMALNGTLNKLTLI